MMENKMTNQERLEEYLVGTNGYLKSDISNGKVIMLSGKWGSGKTHFWQNKIQTVLNDEDKKIPNHYISLYGKTSIDEIRNEVYLKIFESVDSSKLEEKGTTLAKNTIDLILSFIKSVEIQGVKIDLSTVSDNSFRQLEKFLKNKKIKKTVEYLNKSAIICFDDFERKSKDIDLNDLFGFITQLTLNFSCKVVIILNDNVFEGEEKKIFSNVKEKSVSKFLKYEPSIEELFETIFSDDRYRTLDDYKEIILKTIEETQELNARIYIQVLDNLVEWIGKNQDKSNEVLKYLIFVNINFILNHYVFCITNLKFNIGIEIQKYAEIVFLLKTNINFPEQIEKYSNEKSFDNLKNKISIEEKAMLKRNVNAVDHSIALLEFIERNENLVKSWLFFKKINLKELIGSNNKAELEVFNKISNFIETGILINE